MRFPLFGWFAWGALLAGIAIPRQFEMCENEQKPELEPEPPS